MQGPRGGDLGSGRPAARTPRSAPASRRRRRRTNASAPAPHRLAALRRTSRRGSAPPSTTPASPSLAEQPRHQLVHPVEHAAHDAADVVEDAPDVVARSRPRGTRLPVAADVAREVADVLLDALREELGVVGDAAGEALGGAAEVLPGAGGDSRGRWSSSGSLLFVGARAGAAGRRRRDTGRRAGRGGRSGRARLARRRRATWRSARSAVERLRISSCQP